MLLHYDDCDFTKRMRDRYKYGSRAWPGSCWCNHTRVWFWDTNRPRSCGCSNRKAGRPRVNRGMCGFGMRDRVYRWRAQVRDLNHLLARGSDPEGDEAAVLSDARSGGKTGLWRS